MRKILLGSLLAAGSLSAFAQSSVTVYGVADAFAAVARGSLSNKRMTDGGNIASQLGHRRWPQPGRRYRHDTGSRVYVHPAELCRP